MLDFLIDNIFFLFGGRWFQQMIDFPMGTNCAPLMADMFLHRIYPVELEVQDTTDTQKYPSYIDLHIQIDKGGRLNTKLYDKCDDFTFPIVNFPLISSNIPASPVYGVYISQLIHYSRACAQYIDFLYRAQLLTQKLLQQGHIAPRLMSSLQKFYNRHHHNLVDRYEILISQMTMDLLLFT